MEPKRKKSIVRHPLQDPSILERIFTCLSVEDLKACRLTLKVWHEPATRLLTERIQGILLHEKTEWKKILKILTKSCSSSRLQGLNNMHPFHSFIFYGTYPEDPSWTPYKTAILDYVHSKVKLPKKTLWEEKFYQTFGVQILELRYCQFNFLNTEKALREFREMLSTHCPNLQALTLEFQRDPTGSTASTGSRSGTPTASPSPSPSPSPLVSSGSGGSSGGGVGGGTIPTVFFPPNEESLKKTLHNLKRFTFCTDNKSWVNPNALEEFMSFMPRLEEFTYRYTGAKKQWAFVRRVDIIDIICNLVQCGTFNGTLKVLDLDSKGTVLSGEDFRKLLAAFQSRVKVEIVEPEPEPSTSKSDPTKANPPLESLHRKTPSVKVNLSKFCCQVFIKSEVDWDHFCNWLYAINDSLKDVDIQVRSHFSQLPAEEQLPLEFPKVRRATLLLDNNFQVFLKRMPNVEKFCGVFDNELLPFVSATQNLNLDGIPGSNGSSIEEHYNGGGSFAHRRRSSSKRSQRGVLAARLKCSRSRSVEEYPYTTSGMTTPPSTPLQGPSGPLIMANRSVSSSMESCVTQAKYIKIISNEDSMLDIEWKAGLFRHVTILETDIFFDQDLRLIWMHLHQVLKELIVHLKITIPEQAFTGGGVPAITFQDLIKPTGGSRFGKGSRGNNQAGGGGEIDYHEEERLVALDEYPNLGMMKNLKTFEIHTEGRQDAFGTQFSASLIIYGVSLLPQLERLVLPPAIPPKCFENSISYLGKLLHLKYLAVCDDTFHSVLPFHVIKCALPDLEIVVRYYQSEIKRTLCKPWRDERLVFPDFLPEHRSTSFSSVGLPPLPIPNSSRTTGFRLSKQCSAP